MRTLGRIAMVATAIVVVGVGWFAVDQYRRHIDCQQRNLTFERRIKNIERDAHEQLKIGTKRAEITKFFTSHGIPFDIAWSEATGTLNTTGGCAPLGCGTDRALIGVRVKIDKDGTVVDEPVVVGMYVDCL